MQTTDSTAPKPGRSYPVIAVNIEAAAQACADAGRAFDFHGDALEALAAIDVNRRTSVDVAIWAREGFGYDAWNCPAQLAYLFVIAERRAARIAGELRDKLQERWGSACQLEGEHPTVGDERPLWVVDECGIRRV